MTEAFVDDCTDAAVHTRHDLTCIILALTMLEGNQSTEPGTPRDAGGAQNTRTVPRQIR
jgi:hypothetical protein